jgi:hypothetical protein
MPRRAQARVGQLHRGRRPARRISAATRTPSVLLDSGCSATTATHAYNLVDSYVLGFALQESNLPFSNAEELAIVGEQLLAQVPADEYPNLVRVSAGLVASGFDYADEFEFGLDLILGGIGRALQGA